MMEAQQKSAVTSSSQSGAASQELAGKIPRRRSQHLTLVRFMRNRLALVGMCIILTLAIVAVLAPILAPYEPSKQNLRALSLPPSWEHFFGTDQVGRDIFSRVLFGSRYSLTIGLVSISIGLTSGLVFGLFGGYYGGRVDQIIMRGVDIMLAFPGILLAMAIVGAFGPGLFNVMIAVGIWSTPLFARIIRSTVLTIKEQEFIVAARSVGASHLRIILRHILPNCLAPVIVLTSLRMASSILAASSLSFLGLGAQPPTPEWGAMLNDGRNYLRVLPHISTFPGLAIVITVLGFNLLGDGLRDALDPRLK